MKMMKKSKHNAVATKAIITLLDVAAKKHGMKDTRYAVNKWASGQRDRLRLTKQSAVLQKQLAEVEKRLGK